MRGNNGLNKPVLFERRFGFSNPPSPVDLIGGGSELVDATELNSRERFNGADV